MESHAGLLGRGFNHCPQSNLVAGYGGFVHKSSATATATSAFFGPRNANPQSKVRNNKVVYKVYKKSKCSER